MSIEAFFLQTLMLWLASPESHLEKGGLVGRSEATGRGVQYIIKEFFRHEDDCNCWIKRWFER